MYVYDLDVSLYNNGIIDKKLTEAIKEAIDMANISFSAVRYNRKIEFVEALSDTNIHLRMTSRDSINPTRSLSSLSRALVKNEAEKNSGILDEHITNGHVFNARILESSSSRIDNLNPTEIVQQTVEIVLGQKFLNDRQRIYAKEASDKIKEIVLDYVNKKNEA